MKIPHNLSIGTLFERFNSSDEIIVITFGCDSQKKKYIGTWPDLMSDFLWHYEGIVDGNKLVLNSEEFGKQNDNTHLPHVVCLHGAVFFCPIKNFGGVSADSVNRTLHSVIHLVITA